MVRKVFGRLSIFIQTITVILLALIVGAIFIALANENPLECYGVLFRGALGSAARFSEVLVKMVPLLVMALGVSVAFRAKLWNIGAEGQMIVGAIAATFVGLYLPLPPFMQMILAPIFGMIGGAAWAFIAGWLKVRFNANEVITTMMLNYVAVYLLAYMVYGPMQEPGGYNYPQSSSLAESLQLSPLASGARVNSSVFVAIVLLILVSIFWRSRMGYTVDLLGQGTKVVNYAGYNAKNMILRTMMISGAFAGVVGWIEVYGIHFRLIEGIGSGYGDLAVVIALLGNLTPLGILFSSFVISVLLAGGATMQRMTTVPYSIVDIIQGLVIVLLITRPVVEKILVSRKEKRANVARNI